MENALYVIWIHSLTLIRKEYISTANKWEFNLWMKMVCTHSSRNIVEPHHFEFSGDTKNSLKWQEQVNGWEVNPREMQVYSLNKQGTYIQSKRGWISGLQLQ